MPFIRWTKDPAVLWRKPDKFGVGEALSDDPNFYVKLHYFRYPDADPSDENSSDLNEKGIRAFAASLQSNPFAYFTTELV